MQVRVQKIASAIIGTIGVALLAMMVYVEGEPGAIPLLLILVGAAGYVSARMRQRSGAP
jgi:hypothetical protein